MITLSKGNPGSVPDWASPATFKETWKDRIAAMSRLIPAGMSVMDLGAGMLWLRDYLPSSILYLPVDKVARNNETTVCNFNNREFPALCADVCFVSGCLEYVNDSDWFIENMAWRTLYCVISYNTLDNFPNLTFRRNLHWVNDWTDKELIDLFARHGATLEQRQVETSGESLYRFRFGTVTNNQPSLAEPPEQENSESLSALRRKILTRLGKAQRNGLTPSRLALETTTGCSANCIMCPHANLTRPRGIMSMEIHANVLQRLEKLRGAFRMISHAGMGDPLTDATLSAKIRKEKEFFPAAKVAVYTNGALLDERVAQSLIDARLDVLSLSVNAYEKESYEAIMGLSYERTLENIDRFLERNRAAEHSVTVNVSLIPLPRHSNAEIGQFEEFWKQQVASVVIPPFISWGGAFPYPPPPARWPCLYLWDVLMVDWTGKIKLCCEDYDSRYGLGDIMHHDVVSVFNSKWLMALRERQVEGVFDIPPLCRSCIETGECARQYWAALV